MRMNESCRTHKCRMYNCDMSAMMASVHVYVRHVTHIRELCHTYEGVMSHVLMSHVRSDGSCAHTYELCHKYISLVTVTYMNESCPRTRRCIRGTIHMCHCRIYE